MESQVPHVVSTDTAGEGACQRCKSSSRFSPHSLASVDGVRMEPRCSSWCLIGIGGYCLKMISTQSGIYKVQ